MTSMSTLYSKNPKPSQLLLREICWVGLVSPSIKLIGTPFVEFLRKETISHKSKVHATWPNRKEFNIRNLVIYLCSPVIVLLK